MCVYTYRRRNVLLTNLQIAFTSQLWFPLLSGEWTVLLIYSFLVYYQQYDCSPVCSALIEVQFWSMFWTSSVSGDALVTHTDRICECIVSIPKKRSHTPCWESTVMLIHVSKCLLKGLLCTLKYHQSNPGTLTPSELQINLGVQLHKDNKSCIKTQLKGNAVIFIQS